MDDSSTTESDSLTLAHSVASVLGIKGTLRFRPHGSTQKPHVILRRVTVSDESSDDGEVNNIVRFSLFAQKRIEVKPGKEILLSVATNNGLFKEKPVVLEGDLSLPGDVSDEEGETQVADEEDILLPLLEEAMPPKMRKAWTKKNEDPSLRISAPGHPPVGQCPSVSIQVGPSYAENSTQMEPSPSTASVSVQAGSSELPWRSLDEQEPRTRHFTDVEVQTDHFPVEQSSTLESGSWHIPSSTGSITGFKGERSLSPMELDSAPESPGLSSRSSPPYSPVASPIDASLVTNFDLPPFSSSSSRPQAQELQIPLLELDLGLSSPSIASSSGDNFRQSTPPVAKVKPENKDEQPVVVASPNPKLRESVTPLLPASKSLPNFDNDTAGKLPVRSGKPPVHNPFVSAGFITEFVNSPNEPFEVKKSSVVTEQSEEKADESKSLTASRSLDSQSLASSLSSGAAPSTLANLQPAELFTLAQNSAASSSKVSGGKTTPTKPMHYLRLSSSRAFEKSPAIPGAPILQRRPDLSIRARYSSPPPDLKSLTYISTGPLSNPLNIRPSASMAMERPIPTAPKTLAQAAVKKRVVVGAGWPLVKATQPTGPAAATSSASSANSTPVPLPISSPVDRLPNISIKRSSSPPLGNVPFSTPTETPQVKWKRVIGDMGESSALNGHQSTTPYEPIVNGKQDVKEDLATLQTTSLPDKPQLASLKDRIAPVSGNSPTTSVNPAFPSKPNGRDLRSRISDVPLSRSHTASPSSGRLDASPPPLSPASSLAHRALAHSNSTPSLPSPIVSTNPPLNHPLPPKPMTASQGPNNRNAKRERANSPDRSRKKRRSFRWPTVDSNYSTRLMGEGQLGIRSITFNSDGSLFALCCADRTVRIWNSRIKTEIARLAHNASILCVVWMEGDSGVVSLAEDGLISKWTRSGVNYWHWAKVLDAGKNDRADDDCICLAYAHDRIAVSFPRTGVKVWLWVKGTWQPQRSILRQNVTAIKFVNDGAALIGGTRDGVLWHCDIPNGTLRAYTFLKWKIQSLYMTPSGSHVVVAAGAHAKVVTIGGGNIEQSFSCPETEARPNDGFGAIFATEGQAVLFGAVDGCVLVWDRKRGAIVYGLEHEEDDAIQAVAGFDGPTNKEGFLITGTKSGLLSWWSQPVAAPQADDASKRSKPAA